VVSNEAFGFAHRRAATAVRDLRQLGFWGELTRRHDVVRIGSRNGPSGVPADGHLADSLFTSTPLPGGGYGILCDVIVYERALRDDVLRQSTYYAEGRLPGPPPSLRHFWAVIVAHELAHCSKRGQRGERWSTLWERRVLAAYGRSRSGS
jgi:hypothetical protein